MAFSHLIRGHEKFRRRAFAGERAFLQLLASEGQSPDTLFIGCSDSRVVPELLTGSSPGTLFVVRNVANVVPVMSHPDASVGAAIEYAVVYLGVKHIIVCGHTQCGGVQAALTGLDQFASTPELMQWLDGAIQPAIESARQHNMLGDDPDKNWRAVVEESVVVQLKNLLSFPCVADRVVRGEIELHGWLYDLHALALLAYDEELDEFVAVDKMLR